MNADLLAATLEYIRPKADEFSELFYAQLFVRSKGAHDLFVSKGTDMRKQRNLLMSTLYSVVAGIRNKKPGTEEAVYNLGKRHSNYGVPEGYYDLVGEILIKTFKEAMKEAWTPQMEKDWKEAYDLIQCTMLQGAKIESSP